jgi:hypothetical protein
VRRARERQGERHAPLPRVVVERALAGAVYALAGAVSLAIFLGPAAGGIAVVPWLLSLARLRRLAVVVDGDGVLVRNPWRSYYVPWREVANIKGIRTESKNSFLVPGLRQRGRGVAIRLWALAVPADRRFLRANEAERAAQLGRLMERWRQAHGVNVDVS